MFKRIFAVVIASLFIMTACTNDDTPSSSTLPPDPSTSESVSATTEAEGETHTIPVAEVENRLYKMLLEPTSHSTPADEFLVSVLDGFDMVWLYDDDWTSVYNIVDYDTQVEYARVTFTTTPPDLYGHFGVESDEELAEELKAYIFTAENVHDGLLKGARDDFGYTIVTDLEGMVDGYNAFLIEFINEEDNNHAIRLYLSNDELNSNHVALTLNANIPADNEELIEQFRDMLLSVEKSDLT